MARFILDVANLLPHEIKLIQDEILGGKIVGNSFATIICIDESNTAQFNDNQSNELTTEQIKNHSKWCSEENSINN